MTRVASVAKDGCELSWKQSVRQAFGAAAPGYDTHAILQRDTLPTLIDCLKTITESAALNTVVDLGTGTGAAALAVVKLLEECEGPKALASKVIYLNDCSDEMLSLAEKKLRAIRPHLTLHTLAGDAGSLVFPVGGVDVVTAHWVLQWIPDWQTALNHWWQHTQCLAFTVPLRDSFDEWHQACDEAGVAFTLNSKGYPTLAEITQLCESFHPEQLTIKETKMTQHFASGHEFLTSLKKIGAHTPLGKASASLRPVLRATQHGFSVSTHVAWVALSRQPKTLNAVEPL